MGIFGFMFYVLFNVILVVGLVVSKIFNNNFRDR